MAKQINIQQFSRLSQEVAVIDVRSQKEYETAHIPGAINLPLFSNEERALVGTCYKNKGREAATLMGLKFVGPKLEQFATKALQLATNNTLIVHCWRGGMRSASMAWLFETVGLETFVLEGGYKTYRRFIKSEFAKPVSLVVLGGMTGSGKTEILKQLSEKGNQVVDLEGLANHKGSVFGGIGQKEQGTTEQFENNLYEVWKTFDFSKPVWVEDESKNIGRIGVPDELYEKMRNCLVIDVEIPERERVNYLLKDYGKLPPEDLKNAIVRIKKRLGGKDYNTAVKSIDSEDVKAAVEITLKYYDKAYKYGLSKRKKELVHAIECNELNHEINAEKILGFYQSIIG